MRHITQLDLFSGIGGFHLGFEKAGYKVTSFFSEVDKHAIAVYKHQFKDSTYVGSVTDVRGADLPSIDLITFGSPCQDFSLAGKRAGMEGQRSSLILEAIRLIHECRPRVFVWENVKGTFSSNNGADFWAIIQAFANIGGYRLEWQLLNTSWVLPQNRERIYLVGYSTAPERGWRGVFPVGEGSKLFNSKKRNEGQESTSVQNEDNIARALNSRPAFGQGSEDTFIKSLYLGITDKRGNEKSMEKASTLCSVYHKAPSDGDYIKVKQNGVVVPNYSSKSLNETIENNELIEGEPKALDLYNREARDESPTLTEPHHNSLRLFDGYRIRRLTPIECERLQGFPDDHTAFGNYDGEVKPMSNTQRYKQCGNAVTVDIVSLVAEQLKPIFDA